MSYLLFLGYYLLTTLILFLIVFVLFKFIYSRKVKKISLDNEKLLEDFFDKL